MPGGLSTRHASMGFAFFEPDPGGEGGVFEDKPEGWSCGNPKLVAKDLFFPFLLSLFVLIFVALLF